MARRAHAVAWGLAVVALTFGSAMPARAQLYQGPEQGTSAPGQLVTTSAFPPIPPAGAELAPSPPEHEIDLVPDPPGLRPPLAPLGFNEQDDPSWFAPPAAVTTAPGLLRDFQGILQTTNIPPDPIAAAGPNHLMALVNRFFAIFSKNGTNLQQVFAPSWFNNVVPGNNAFDPKVIYDHFDDRWVMVWLAVDRDTLSLSSHILISVSDDADPNGTWCNFALRGDFNGSTPSTFWSDYQGVGFDGDAVYVVPNQFPFDDGSPYVKLRIIPKSDLYDPACPAVTYTDFWDLRDPDFPDVRVFTVRPAVTFGSPGVEYLINDASFFTGTTMTLWSLTNPLDPSPILTATNVPVTQRQPPPNADQLGGSSILIDVGGPRVRNLVYRDGSVWTAQSVADMTGNYARARYVRIDVAGPTVLEDVSFGSDGCWLYYPAITADVNDNMTMVYSRSCLDTYIDIRYTGRRPTDAGLRPSAGLKIGEANYVKDLDSGRNRWGDYSGVAVDPANPTRVWMFAEYASSPSSTWGTWFGEVIARGEGDVNDDGDVNVGDVVLLVDIILERATADPVTAAISDCNRDGMLNIGDVVCLVDLILGDGGAALVASRTPASSQRSGEARLSLASAGRLPEGRTVLLEAELGAGVAGVQARISYDPNRVRLGTPELTPRAQGFNLAFQDKGDELLLLIYDASGRTLAAGAGALVRLPVHIGPVGPAGEDLGLELRQVLLAHKSGGVRSARVVRANLTTLPVEFRLSNAYPNPLIRGTGTKLDLQIPEAIGPALSGEGGRGANGAVRVVVDVYNVRGQRVRQLMDVYLLPGQHMLEWDGRNDRGEHVGTGLYVLRLRAGSFAATRKLIVPGG